MDKMGEEIWQQYRQASFTRVLIYELQEAVSQQRPPDVNIIKYCLDRGADANAMGSPGTAWLIMNDSLSSEGSVGSDEEWDESSESESDSESSEESSEESEESEE